MTAADAEIESQVDRGSQSLFWLAVLAMVCQLPFVVIYFINLSRYSHYEFFPVILIACGLLFWNRKAWELLGGRLRQWSAAVALAIGILATVCAVAFMSSWMAYFAFLGAAGAALMLLRDRESGLSLASLWVLFAVLWQPPYNSKLTADVVVTAFMQRLSTRYVSVFLDWLHVPHFNQGTVISIRGLEMGVEEACSGIQSLFLYIAMAVLCGVYFRRSGLHTACLLGSAFGWALVTNTLRIICIALAHLGFHVDLTHGFLHSLLGYVLMAVGIGLIASFDQLLLWLLPAPRPQPIATAATLAVPSWRTTHWGSRGVAVVLGLLLLAQLVDLGALTADRKTIDFFSGDSIVQVEKAWLPESLAGWELEDYRREERSLISDLGQQSDIWIYRKGDQRVNVSFDQVFPGWHELTRCYEGRGWKCGSRELFEYGQIQGSAGVRARMVKDVEGVLMFLMVGQTGELVAAPGDWDLFSSMFHRIKNRLSPRLRASVFEAEAYQIQVFSTQATESDLQQLLDQALAQIQRQLSAQ